MRDLGCITCALLGNSALENMGLIAEAGFTKTFYLWDDNVDAKAFSARAHELGIEIETLHSPFDVVSEIWNEGEIGDRYTERLRRCVWVAAEYGIPYVVVHTTCTNRAPLVSNLGIVRFGKIVHEAQKLGVKLAFENLEFVRHLALVMDEFKDSPNVGFCYDVGHEHCYSPGIKYLPLFGDRLFCTHIHDNLGIAPTKDMDYRDDLHRIPFDGNIDFSEVCRGIKATGFEGTLMLEVANRKDYDFYKGYTPEQFYKKAYESALKLRELCDGKN